MSEPIKNRYEFVILFYVIPYTSSMWKTATQMEIRMRGICPGWTRRPAWAS